MAFFARQRVSFSGQPDRVLGRFQTEVSTQRAQQVDSKKCKFTLK